jgi:hypothetical protein
MPKGTHGILHLERSKELSTPLTPQEMFEHAVQVLDKNGRRVAFATGIYTGGGVDKHAEPIALRGLEANGPKAAIDDGKMIIVLEKTPCEDCRPKLVSYAKSKGITEIEIYLTSRARMDGKGTTTAKQGARTSFMAGRPSIDFSKPAEVIKVPRKYGPSGGGGGAGSARTAVRGMATNLVAGEALSIFTSWFKSKMLRDLENLPKPKIDKRNAQDYFTDPNTRAALTTADVLGKNLRPFARELQEHHVSIVGTIQLELAVLAHSGLSYEARLDFLNQQAVQLQVYLDQLLTVRDNLEAAKKLERKCLDDRDLADVSAGGHFRQRDAERIGIAREVRSTLSVTAIGWSTRSMTMNSRGRRIGSSFSPSRYELRTPWGVHPASERTNSSAAATANREAVSSQWWRSTVTRPPSMRSRLNELASPRPRCEVAVPASTTIAERPPMR